MLVADRKGKQPWFSVGFVVVVVHMPLFIAHKGIILIFNTFLKAGLL